MFTPVDRIAWEAGGVKERESITRRTRRNKEMHLFIGNFTYG